MSDAPRTARLTITAAEDGLPSVRLNDLELSSLLLSGGLSFRYVQMPDGWDAPEVTMVFAPGSLALDFDVDLLRSLLTVAETEAERA